MRTSSTAAMGADLLRDDPALREAFRAGERWAMEAVYKSYLPLVTAVACHGTGSFRGFFDPCRRDDAIQTVFLKAFEERSRLAYNGLDPYSRYLRGIAFNVCRQLLDKDRRFRRVPDAAPGSERGPDVEGELASREAHALLARFRDGLDPRERQVLTRYFQEGASEEGLAAELGLTRYRTRKIIKGLHKRMVKYLRGHGITHG